MVQEEIWFSPQHMCWPHRTVYSFVGTSPGDVEGGNSVLFYSNCNIKLISSKMLGETMYECRVSLFTLVKCIKSCKYGKCCMYGNQTHTHTHEYIYMVTILKILTILTTFYFFPKWKVKPFNHTASFLSTSSRKLILC